jgi:hypothetical protein
MILDRMEYATFGRDYVSMSMNSAGTGSGIFMNL